MAGLSKEAPIPPWGLAVAGATGAVLANAIVYPLDMYILPIPMSYPWPRFAQSNQSTAYPDC
jgi:hypothetical protein